LVGKKLWRGGGEEGCVNYDWDVLKVDIIKVFSDFHVRGKFEKSLNASFITLILKTPGAIDTVC
jgi:hypothetical protein